jgi:hypothetical protein
MSLETNLTGRVFAGAANENHASFFSRRLVGATLGAVGLAGLWYLRRPYKGLWHDALIYMGRGLADLDPQGVGTDLSFRYDGQSTFSIFSKIVDGLILVLGFGDAAFVLSVTGLALWLAALAALASQLAAGRQKWAILICVAAAGGDYGGFGVFSYAESFATPRPLAEAGVIAALAALLSGARGRAILFVALAALFHPIMALAGAGVVYLHLCMENRRWISFGAAGALGVVAAALAGFPFFSRLVQNFDWNWLVLLRLRTTYLFPLSWPQNAWASIAVGVLTLGFAAAHTSGKVRRLFASVLIVSLGGLAVAILFGDLYPLQLIEQAQLWRATWLLTLFSTIALCFTVPHMLGEGAAGHAALALFAIAWGGDKTPAAVLFCCLAIAVSRMRGLISETIMRVLAYVFGAIAVLAAATDLGAHFYKLIEVWRDTPAGGFDLPEALGASSAQLRTPIMAAALMWANGLFPFSRRMQIGAAVVAAVLAMRAWSGAGDDFTKLVAANMRPPELERMIAAREGEVLWVGENMIAPWALLGRANWALGGGILFSRDFAIAWRDRMLAMIDNDWIDRRIFALWLLKGGGERRLPEFTREKIERICSRKDAPAWIMGAVTSRAALPSDVRAQFWRAPTRYVRHDVEGEMVWDAVREIAVIDCSRF